MSVYRKDNNGNLRKIAGSLTQRLNTAIFKAAHTVENGADYYTISEVEAMSYISSLTDNTNFWIYIDESNVTNEVYLRYKEQVLRVSLNKNTTIPIDSMYGKTDLFTLKASETGIIEVAEVLDYAGDISAALDAILGV